MQPTGIDFVSYNVADLGRAVAFYRDTLGLTVTFHGPGGGFSCFPWAELEAGGVTVALIGTAGAPLTEVDLTSRWPEHRWTTERPAYVEPPSSAGPQHGGAMIALAVPDVRATVEELRAAGVPIVMEPWESPVCYLAAIADPDGNRLWLHQSTRRPPAADPPPSPERERYLSRECSARTTWRCWITAPTSVCATAPCFRGAGSTVSSITIPLRSRRRWSGEKGSAPWSS